MCYAKNPQRPRKRREQVKKRQRVKHQSAPLGQERNAAVSQGIPQRHFATPKAFAVIKRHRVTVEAVISKDKSARSQDNIREKNKDEDCQQGRKTARREPRVCGFGLRR